MKKLIKFRVLQQYQTIFAHWKAEKLQVKLTNTQPWQVVIANIQTSTYLHSRVNMSIILELCFCSHDEYKFNIRSPFGSFLVSTNSWEKKNPDI